MHKIICSWNLLPIIEEIYIYISVFYLYSLYIICGVWTDLNKLNMMNILALGIRNEKAIDILLEIYDLTYLKDSVTVRALPI